MRYIILLSFWTLLPLFHASPRTEAQPQGAPKPVVQVSFERQTVRENDCIRAYVLLSNVGDQPLTSVTLRIAAPFANDGSLSKTFLKSHRDSCAGGEVDFAIGLECGPVKPNDVFKSTVYLTTDPRIVVGEFNILFTFEYTWQQQGKSEISKGGRSKGEHSMVSGRSFVSIEKSLKVSLLGSETIAGVPLSLASYVVPGLFFWLVIGIEYFKVPWSRKDMPLGDKLIYSLVVSFLIIGLSNRFSLPNVNGGITLGELSTYAVLGISLGFLVGVAYVLTRRISEKRNKLADAKLISSSDSNEVLLEKLLELPQSRRRLPQTIVRFSDGREFIGSLATSTTNLVALAGWFKIDRDSILAPDKQEFEDLYEKKQLLELVQLARKKNVQIEALNPIYELKDGERQELEDQTRTWPFERQSIRFAEEPGDWEPIELQ